MSTTTPQNPSPEEMAQMQAVAQAGAQAGAETSAAGGSSEQASEAAKTAMRRKADEVKLQIDDKQLEQIADMFVAKTIEQFEQRGAFDPAPEPVRPPTQEEAPNLPAEQRAAAAADAPAPPEQTPQRPERQSWAQRYFGS